MQDLLDLILGFDDSLSVDNYPGLGKYLLSDSVVEVDRKDYEVKTAISQRENYCKFSTFIKSFDNQELAMIIEASLNQEYEGKFMLQESNRFFGRRVDLYFVTTLSINWIQDVEGIRSAVSMELQRHALTLGSVSKTLDRIPGHLLSGFKDGRRTQKLRRYLSGA